MIQMKMQTLLQMTQITSTAVDCKSVVSDITWKVANQISCTNMLAFDWLVFMWVSFRQSTCNTLCSHMMWSCVVSFCREEAKHALFTKGQSRRIWNELYKVMLYCLCWSAIKLTNHWHWNTSGVDNNCV